MKLTGDKVNIVGSNFTHIRRAGLFVDATDFLFINNKIESLATHGVSGNNNLFNFSLNTINTIQDEAFQITALIVDISKNTFNSFTGLYNLRLEIIF